MGRPSKLSEDQWSKITDRMAKGESARALGKEFKISEAAIRLRVSATCAEIKEVANQIVAVETRLKSLPISAQVTTHNLADMLRSISSHLAGAANFGASTAHRLAAIANSNIDKLDDIDPLSEESMTTLKGITALTFAANEAGKIGMNLLNANKEQAGALLNQDTPEQMNWTINAVPAISNAG